MQNILHKVNNKTSYLMVTGFGDLIRVYYSNDTYGTCSYSFLDKKHLEAIKKYKSPFGATRYAGKHDIVKSAKHQQDLEIEYARYVCKSDNTPPLDDTSAPIEQVARTNTGDAEGAGNVSLSSASCSSSCPVSAPAPAKLSGKRGRDILFVDTETTGIGYDDEIVEIAVVDINENVVFESLVKPSKPIPKKATQVHGITNAMVADAPSFSEIWSDFYNAVTGGQKYRRKVVFYNMAFDTRMIAQSAARSFDSTPVSFVGLFSPLSMINPPVCLMTDYAKYWGEWNDYHNNYKWQTLVKACRQQKIPIHDIPNHRASGDAIKTARLYKVLLGAGVLS